MVRSITFMPRQLGGKKAHGAEQGEAAIWRPVHLPSLAKTVPSAGPLFVPYVCGSGVLSRLPLYIRGFAPRGLVSVSEKSCHKTFLPFTPLTATPRLSLCNGLLTQLFHLLILSFTALCSPSTADSPHATHFFPSCEGCIFHLFLLLTFFLHFLSSLLHASPYPPHIIN